MLEACPLTWNKKRWLNTKQEEERKMTELRLKLQSREIERRLKTLDNIDARELAAVERDMLSDERVMARGQDNAMPSLEGFACLQQMEVNHSVPNLLDAFAKAKDTGRVELWIFRPRLSVRQRITVLINQMAVQRLYWKKPSPPN